MPATQIDLLIEQNATFRKRLKLSYTADGLNPVDLTGCTARAQFRLPGVLDTVVIDIADGSGITLEGTTGVITLELPATVTKTLAPRTLLYDLLIYYPSGDILRTIQGSAIVSPGVTQ